jgi:hypothetical protein
VGQVAGVPINSATFAALNGSDALALRPRRVTSGPITRLRKLVVALMAVQCVEVLRDAASANPGAYRGFSNASTAELYSVFGACVIESKGGA